MLNKILLVTVVIGAGAWWYSYLPSRRIVYQDQDKVIFEFDGKQYEIKTGMGIMLYDKLGLKSYSLVYNGVTLTSNRGDKINF